MILCTVRSYVGVFVVFVTMLVRELVIGTGN